MTNDSRKSMEKALKEIFVLDLKKNGFKGSFPHFRRVTIDSIDLLTFQFYSSGGSFVIEIAQCPAEGFRNASGVLTPPDKVQVKHVWPRLRLGAKPEQGINVIGLNLASQTMRLNKNIQSSITKKSQNLRLVIWARKLKIGGLITSQSTRAAQAPPVIEALYIRKLRCRFSVIYSVRKKRKLCTLMV
jgi:hypothetical protein